MDSDMGTFCYRNRTEEKREKEKHGKSRLILVVLGMTAAIVVIIGVLVLEGQIGTTISAQAAAGETEEAEPVQTAQGQTGQLQETRVQTAQTQTGQLKETQEQTALTQTGQLQETQIAQEQTGQLREIQEQTALTQTAQEEAVQDKRELELEQMLEKSISTADRYQEEDIFPVLETERITEGMVYNTKEEKLYTELLSTDEKDEHLTNPDEAEREKTYIPVYNGISDDEKTVQEPDDVPEKLTYTYNEDMVRSLSKTDYEVLCRIVEAEATGHNIYGKILVANVVLNRVIGKTYPDTVEEVVFQKIGKSYQFSPIYDGRYYTVTVTESTIEAVNRALSGEDYSQGAEYFFCRKKTSGKKAQWFENELNFELAYSGHEFYSEK